MMSTLGQQGYEAYGEAGRWETFDGRVMPKWEALSQEPSGKETQRRWELAAQAIVAQAQFNLFPSVQQSLQGVPTNTQAF